MEKPRHTVLRRLMAAAMMVLALTAWAPRAHSLSFALDSIAAWGRFPKFCIDTYRWGDKFFNGYDTTFVQGSGYKFNIKMRTDSWLETQNFRFDDNKYQMRMWSYPSTSAGLWLTYMAVSAGYDLNVSEILGLVHSTRKRFNFQFNCMLFAADLYLQTSDNRMRITSFGPTHAQQSVSIPFDNLSSTTWGLNAYYFFHHKQYSQAAAFSYSRIQKRSSGSLFAGLSFTGQTYRFDFSSLPQELLQEIPSLWPNYSYHIHAHNYALILGYGYNFVLSKKCIIGLSDAPTIGLRYGYINNPDDEHTTFYGFNRFKVSFVWNNDHWFAGVVGVADTNMFSNPGHSLIASTLSFEASVGYRFNLW